MKFFEINELFIWIKKIKSVKPNGKKFLILILGASIIMLLEITINLFTSSSYYIDETLLGDNSNLQIPSGKKFVSVCRDTFNSRRTGNLMFTLAALLYVSKYTGRLPIMPQNFDHDWIDKIFINDITRLPNRFIYNKAFSVEVNETKEGPTYDPKFKNLHDNENYKNATIILICGYFQSYRYVGDVEEELRYYLKFKNSTVKSVDEFIKNETNYSSDTSFIGLHVRRSDFTYAKSVRNGLTVVDKNYINISMDYIMKSFKYSQSIVTFMCGDDLDWIQDVVEELNFEDNYPKLKIVYSIDHSPAFDLCLLSKCDATIISTGTYSWWAGWLSNTTTVYYSLYPNRNTAFGANFDASDYYPHTWKGLP